MRTSIIASVALVVLAASPVAAEELPATPSATPSAAPGVEIPDFATKSWIVVDAGSGDVLAGQNSDERRPMASTIKTLTALTLLPRLQYDSVYEAASREALTEGAHVGVLAGNRYSVDELFHGMLMRSGNDAAVALADAYGYQRTIDAMNEEARRVGAVNTVAMSPNGLDQPGQVTTAADLAQIYRVAIQDPRLQEILTVREAQFPGRPPQDPKQARSTFTIYNHDSLLTSSYPGFMGGKSGFTSQAGRTYVAGAEQNGRRLVVALLGIGGGTTQTARQLLDWSFANADRLEPIGQLPAVAETAAITPEPAGSNADPDDLAPLPLDPAIQADVQTIGQAAIDTVALAASTAPSPAAPADTQAVVQAARNAADLAFSTAAASGTPPATSTTSGVAADMNVAGLQAPPFVATSDQPAPPAERGLLASLLIGLFKVLLWILLFLGIAVVLLRIRAVRRQNRRRAARAEAMRRAGAHNREAAPTPRRVPSRTG